MFCPECESEYREGFTQCSDCSVALVETLDPARLRSDDEALAPLHVTSESGILAHLADDLEKAGVPYVVVAGTGLPLLDYADVAGDFEPQPWEGRIMIHGPQMERAREILLHVLQQLENRPVPRNRLSSKTQIVG